MQGMCFAIRLKISVIFLAYQTLTCLSAMGRRHNTYEWRWLYVEGVYVRFHVHTFYVCVCGGEREGLCIGLCLMHVYVLCVCVSTDVYHVFAIITPSHFSLVITNITIHIHQHQSALIQLQISQKDKERKNP